MSAKLLILEDDPEASQLLEATFRLEEFETLKAAGAREAEAVLFSKPVDLVIVDRILPDSDGLDFVKEIRQLPCFRYTGVMFLSAKNLLQDKLDGLASGGDDYVCKPFFPDELVSRTKAVLKFVSPMLHPLSHLPGHMAFQRECERLGGDKSVKFYGLLLTGFETFKSLFPDRVAPLMAEVGEILYREMASFEMADFAAHLQDDCFVLMARQERGEVLVERIKKSFGAIRKKYLRQSAFDFFKKPPENMLNLQGGELAAGSCKEVSEKGMEKLRELRKDLETLSPK